MAGGGIVKLQLFLLFLGFMFFTTTCSYPISVNQAEIFDRKHVYMENDIDPNIALTFHCKSANNDLGEQTLSYRQNFHWSFRINLASTTMFWCNMWWNDLSGKGMKMSFHAYEAKRDWRRNCRNHCYWSFRQDGGYYGDGKDSVYLMFNWNSTQLSS
ncbi:hypothetical protein MKX01_009816 [Papaver californicum]|nr:hypothetical protein MKX01_009816 [Papaver californicum]